MNSLPPLPERPRRILVVDDDEARRELFARLLRREGHEVDVLPNGESVIAHVRTRSPDLVLLDVMLPGISGIELCGDLRMLDEMRLVPIVLVTSAFEDEESVVRGLLCGADDYITTPARLAELKARIHVQLRNRRDREVMQWACAQRDMFKNAARTDGLTGLVNRRYAEIEIDRILASDQPLLVAMIDVDHFKRLNDTLGHAEGDRALRTIARSLQDQARARDVIARWGGEEFVALLPGARVESAARIAQRYLDAVCRLGLSAGAGLGPVTVSIGIAGRDDPHAPTTRAAIVEAADVALYQAKRAGRARAVVHRVTTSGVPEAIGSDPPASGVVHG